ncbi:MAG: hypothetical protein ABR577_12345 [Pyrinomonadaceae bacterium]
MSNTKDKTDAAISPPPLKRDGHGQVDSASLAEVIGWFLDYDQRVAVVKHRNVEELFQWKQAQSKASGEAVFAFDHAEDRFAIGVVQAVAAHANERALHGWISQLLNAIEDASKTNGEISAAHKLKMADTSPVMDESLKIPSPEMRELFLTCCWLEALCTAEIRVLGWIYQELYGRAFRPDNI